MELKTILYQNQLCFVKVTLTLLFRNEGYMATIYYLRLTKQSRRLYLKLLEGYTGKTNTISQNLVKRQDIEKKMFEKLKKIKEL